MCVFVCVVYLDVDVGLVAAKPLLSNALTQDFASAWDLARRRGFVEVVIGSDSERTVAF